MNKKIKTNGIIIFTGLALTFSILSVNPAFSIDPITNPPISPVDPISMKGKLKLDKDPLLPILDLKDAKVGDVIKSLVKKTGLNLIIDTPITGESISHIRLENIPLSEALAFILKMKKLVGRRINNTLIISDEETLKAKGLDNPITKPFVIHNTKVTDVKTKLSSVFEANKGISPPTLIEDERTNTLLVIGNLESITLAESIIPTFDKIVPQVVIEIKLIELTTQGSKQLGIGYGFGQGKFGIGFNTEGSPAGDPKGIPASGDSTVLSFTPLENFTANFNAKITALIQDSQARIISNPRIATQDNVDAIFESTENAPVVTVSTTATVSQQSVNAAGVSIGEKITITPRIDTVNGYITMKITPEISSRGKDVLVNNNPVPETLVRKLTTTITVKDGESIILGGLKRKNSTSAESKVPILGDIPLIGNLFKNSKWSDAETELIIVVTPHIMKY